MKRKYAKVVCLVLFASIVISGIAWKRRSRLSRSTSSSSSSSYTAASTIHSNSSTSTKITALLVLLKKDPKNAIISNRLGYLYYSLKKYKKAKYYYQKGITANERNIEARLGLYNISMISKDYAQAVTYCREVKAIDNLNYYANLYMVYARMAQYNYKSAEQTCSKMLSVYPCDKTFLGLLRLNYYYQKQTNKAKQIQIYLDMLR